MPSVKQFRAAMKRGGGVARKHRWAIVANFPTYAATNELSRDTALTAITATVPPAVIGEMLVTWGGRELPLPADRKFEAWPVTFIGLQNAEAHTAFIKWQESINGSSSNAASADADEYLRDWSIQLLDDKDNVIKTYTLEDCWPQTVGELELDQTAVDDFMQFTVTLRFFQATSDDTL